MTDEELIGCAAKAKRGAYAPYSHFKVGAALLTRSGKVYLGCNVENAAYGECMCAERVALFKAISEGERDFAAIAIVGDNGLCPPCGSCRQVLSEFCKGDMPVILLGEKLERHALSELLPLSFRLEAEK